MMLFLSAFVFPGEEAESDFMFGLKTTYDQSVYPYGILPKAGLNEIIFRPITILYGGNGSGKSTALNVMAEKLRLSEEPHLALFVTGKKELVSWVRREEESSFYQLHAYVNNVLRRLGVSIDRCTLEPLAESPERKLYSDGLVIKAQNGKVLGFMAIVAPAVLKQFDLGNPVYYADLDWKQLLKQNKQYKPVIEDLPKFPEVKRDFALLVDKGVDFADLARAAFDTEKKLLKNVYLFDVYEGKNLEEGKKSYALSFILQDKENTLKDQQIDTIMSRLQKAFEEKFGAKLR